VPRVVRKYDEVEQLLSAYGISEVATECRARSVFRVQRILEAPGHTAPASGIAWPDEVAAQLTVKDVPNQNPYAVVRL
jgi:hypothetical protein